MNVINTEGMKDLPTARWFMDRRHPDFAVKVKAEADEPLQPSLPPTMNISIGNNVNAGDIQELVRDMVREVFGSRARKGIDRTGGSSGVEESA
jgi:hypothetical protein